MTTIEGVLFFHSETGTEGGYWAVQDKRFITPPPEDPRTKCCQNCRVLWTFAGPDARPEPVPQFTYYRPGWTEDGRTYRGGYFGSDEWIEDGQTAFGDEPEGSFNDVYIRRSNERARECKSNGHNWELYLTGPTWSPEGFNVLTNGDLLTVFENDGETVKWEGVIELQQHPLFTEHASGLWIHADQVGVDRDEWAALFFAELPCRLVRKQT